MHMGGDVCTFDVEKAVGISRWVGRGRVFVIRLDVRVLEAKMRSLGGALVLVVLIGFGMYMKYSRKGDLSAEMRVVALESIATCATYEKNAAYMDQLCDQCHDSAFDSAYRMGGRRSGGSFDEEKYILALFKEMSDRAAAEGRKDVAEELREFRAEIATGGG